MQPTVLIKVAILSLSSIKMYNAHLPDIDYTINENDTVYEAVQKFAAYNVGCLVTVDADG